MEYHFFVSISSFLFFFLNEFSSYDFSEMTQILLNCPDKKDMSANNSFFKYCKSDHEF